MNLENIVYIWHTANDLPPKDGKSRLVMLREDNELGWTSKIPVIAEYGDLVEAPTAWTVWDGGMHHEDISNDVIFWTDLPKPPNANVQRHGRTEAEK